MTPISLVADVPTAMVVRAEGPLRSVQDVVAAAKARPGTLTYGSGGAGSSNHLSGALFAAAAGVELDHISYRGAAPAMTALYAGEIDMVFASTVETLPHVRAGRARLLGVATAQRVAAPARHAGHRRDRAGLCRAELVRHRRAARPAAADRGDSWRRPWPRCATCRR